MSQNIQHPENAFLLSIPCVSLGEFDIGGVLYHANYFHIYERAREELMQKEGVPYSSLVDRGAHLTVTETHQMFHAPVLYGAELEVYLWATHLKHASLQFNYEIFRKDVSPEAGLLHVAWTRHAYVTEAPNGFKVAAMPDELMAAFSNYKS